MTVFRASYVDKLISRFFMLFVKCFFGENGLQDGFSREKKNSVLIFQPLLWWLKSGQTEDTPSGIGHQPGYFLRLFSSSFF
jgi:hypothetical protein